MSSNLAFSFDFQNTSQIDLNNLFQQVPTTSFTRRSIGKGHTLFRMSEHCHSFIWLFKGRLRLERTTDEGRILTIQRLQSGECCSLSATSLLAGDYHQVDYIAEEDSTVFLLNKTIFLEMFLQSESFRNFVFGKVDNELQLLLGSLESIAYEPLEHRLRKLLLQKAQNNIIQCTHEALARDLGTAREVISRLLKSFQINGILECNRGHIKLLDASKLESGL
ncbi:MAG: Crp/Fnr family transcriptional regulator [Gammaproteobacteria bacterium]|nr:Crp/Fnr family transcriptional regulator [Gammaproteobacteria bacterium]MDH5730777.1 Crp/Fnr family transcriptional regulator [Gammaproteobacteria bacterium]